ncbi:MAG TPA: hypothetical protein VFX15_02615, partial [Actinomycetes bacterium]|nr:hypothetical protein [Actinomycetes bacterium]
MRTTSRLMVALLLAVAAPLVTPMTSANAAGDVSSWAMDGTKGDWVSGGNSYYYDALDGATIIAEGTEQAIQLHVTKGSHYFYANVAAPVGETLDAGDVFRNATRFGGETPRLEVYGDGRGCNEMLGDFVIHDLDFDGGTGDVLQMSVTFEQHCETGQSALLGSIAFNADAAEPIPSLGEIAFSGGALDAGLGAPSGLSVNVDATGSGDNSTIKTHWDASNDSDVIGYTAVIVPSTEPASEPWGNEQFFRGTTRSASTKVNSRAIRTVSVFGYDADGNWSEPVAKTIRPSKLSIGLSDGSVKY